MNELEISAYSHDFDRLLGFTSNAKTITDEESKNLILQISVNELTTLNLGTPEEPKEISLAGSLDQTEWEEITEVLRRHEKVFAWSYEDMPGIDREIVEHRIPLLPNARPVKQVRRRMNPKWADQIKTEVEKQIKAGFLEVVTYSDWIANIVPVPKKDGRVRMCVDYRDLNKACPKDDFPLPHIDILVDNAANSQMLSFMDGFSGYNQILMAEEDKLKTSFTTEWGIYCYRVMPFGLKNAGATYQRMATTLLHEMIHKEVKVYVDDILWYVAFNLKRQGPYR